MTDQQILEKAIQKAIDGGWRGEYSNSYFVELTAQKIADHYFVHDRDHYMLIYSHDFAKALWGESWPAEISKRLKYASVDFFWKYHLQQMVVAEDPIKYLGENI